MVTIVNSSQTHAQKYNSFCFLVYLFSFIFPNDSPFYLTFLLLFFFLRSLPLSSTFIDFVRFRFRPSCNCRHLLYICFLLCFCSFLLLSRPFLPLQSSPHFFFFYLFIVLIYFPVETNGL